MGKLTKIAIGAVGFWLGLTLLHAWLNLGIGQRKGVADEARFRVGFLPVT